MESKNSIYDAIDEAKVRYYEYSQGDDESNAKNLNNFKDTVLVIEHP